MDDTAAGICPQRRSLTRTAPPALGSIDEFDQSWGSLCVWME